jgi:hypothetical protein
MRVGVDRCTKRPSAPSLSTSGDYERELEAPKKSEEKKKCGCGKEVEAGAGVVWR